MKTKGINKLKQEIITLTKRIDELKQSIKDKEEFTPEEYLNIEAARQELIEEIYGYIKYFQLEIEIQERLDAESAERNHLEETNIDPAVRELFKKADNIIESSTRESLNFNRYVVEYLQSELEKELKKTR